MIMVSGEMRSESRNQTWEILKGRTVYVRLPSITDFLFGVAKHWRADYDRITTIHFFLSF